MKKFLLILFFSISAFVLSAQNAKFDSIENVINSMFSVKNLPNQKVIVKAKSKKIKVNIVSVSPADERVEILQEIMLLKGKETLYYWDKSNVIKAIYLNKKLQFCEWKKIADANSPWYFYSKLIFVRDKVITIKERNKRAQIIYF
jgi:hypothetical protein